MGNLVKLELRRNNYSGLSIDRFDESLTILLKWKKPLLAHSGYVVSSQATTRLVSQQGLFLFGENMSHFKDLTQKKFGRLLVLSYAEKRHWNCLCDCGNQKVIGSSNLMSNRARSCGCLRKETLSKTAKTHGKSTTSEYCIFRSAMARCRNQNNRAYARYGGRGIEFRFNSFEDFIQEVGYKPTKNHTLDRINNDGHYEKGNLRWATRTEQNRNRVDNIRITYNGRTLVISEWIEVLGRSQNVYDRHKKGWCLDCVFSASLVIKCKHNKRINLCE